MASPSIAEPAVYNWLSYLREALAEAQCCTDAQLDALAPESFDGLYGPRHGAVIWRVIGRFVDRRERLVTAIERAIESELRVS